MVTDEREGFDGAMSRIVEHPILGAPSKGSRVVFTYDGVEMEGYEGEPIAMALKAAGVEVHRFTAKRHEPRGIFCAIGWCADCVMVGDRDNDVNGAKTCGIPCIGVAWGYAEPGELLSAGAIYLAETVDALEDILAR